MDQLLIAPCGMNCGLCLAFLRQKNRCSGCMVNDGDKPKSCQACIIFNCALLKLTDSGFCYDCEKFPCRRLKQLDKRYRTKYNMSMLDNLANIKTNGLASFTKEQELEWKCPDCGGTVCVHRGYCLQCN